MAGYGLPPEDAFPAQLEARLKRDGYNVHVLNDGVSGDTTAGGVSRVDSVISQKPDAALVVLGGNDLLRGVPPVQVRANMDSILLKLQAAHIRVLVAGQKAPLTYGAAYADAYNGIFCGLAKTYGAECYPFFLESVYAHAGLMQQDGIHPNKEGVATVIGQMYPEVVKLLGKVRDAACEVRARNRPRHKCGWQT